MKLRYMNFYACMIACIVSFVVTSKVQAQAVLNLNLGGPGQANAATTVDELQGLLEVRVEEIGEIVELSDKQVTQLKLSAKVVAKKVFSERQGGLRVPRGQSQSSDGSEESFSDEDEESQPKESTPNPLKRIRGGILLSTAENHKTWQTAINSILTEEQQTGIEEHKTNRSQRLRDVVVQYRTWEFVKSLRLRDDQIDPVAAVVDRIEGDQLVAQLGNTRGITIMGPGVQQPRSVTAEDLNEILTETQMKAFKDLRGRNNPTRRRRGNWNNRPSNRTLGRRGVELDSNAARPTVETVKADSFFEKMGVKVGDIIDEVNGTPVDTEVQINRALIPSDKVVLTVVRDGESIELGSKE